MANMRRRRSSRSGWGVSLISVLVLALFGLVLADPQGMIFGSHSVASAGTVLRVTEIEAEHDDGLAGSPSQIVLPNSSAALLDEFEQLDYELASVRAGNQEVPRLYLASLPSDLTDIDAAVTRKQLFIQTMLPLILRANETVRAERDLLIDIVERIDAALPLSDSESQWLDKLAERYGAESGDIEGLMNRVDVLPPSLAIAQAAVESGWGTSRFAREGNAVYGQRVFKEGAGIVPEDRDANGTHEVRAFESLYDSVLAYLHNLNSHWAYDDLRANRAAVRASGQRLQAGDLLVDLVAYSEEREKYLRILKRVIKENDLKQFDYARLDRLQLVSLEPAYQ
jgi:Bax protein